MAMAMATATANTEILSGAQNDGGVERVGGGEVCCAGDRGGQFV